VNNLFGRLREEIISLIIIDTSKFVRAMQVNISTTNKSPRGADPDNPHRTIIRSNDPQALHV
jgi:hypothetical protein